MVSFTEEERHLDGQENEREKKRNKLDARRRGETRVTF